MTMTDATTDEEQHILMNQNETIENNDNNQERSVNIEIDQEDEDIDDSSSMDEDMLEDEDIDDSSSMDEDMLEALLALEISTSPEIEIDTNCERTAYFPYKSWPEMLLRQWKIQEGQTLGQTAFNSLIRLLHIMVKNWGSQPELWPKNFKQILQAESVHISKACSWQVS